MPEGIIGTLVARLLARAGSGAPPRPVVRAPPMKPPQRGLIVDDDASAREWLAAFMSSRGLAPASVGSGEEAVEEIGGPARLGHARPGPAGDGRPRDGAGAPAMAPRVAVLVLSGTGDTQAIVEAVGSAPPTSCASPARPEELDAALDKALAALRRSSARRGDGIGSRRRGHRAAAPVRRPEPQDARGRQHDRPRRGHGHHGPDSRRERDRQGARRAHDLRRARAARAAPS